MLPTVLFARMNRTLFENQWKHKIDFIFLDFKYSVMAYMTNMLSHVPLPKFSLCKVFASRNDSSILFSTAVESLPMQLSIVIVL